MEIDQKKLYNRIAGGEETDKTLVAYYSFINKNVYDKALEEGSTAAAAFARAVIHGKDVYQHHDGTHWQGDDRCFFGSFLTDNSQEEVSIEKGKITFHSDVIPVYNTPQIGDEDNELHYMVAGGEYYIAVMAYEQDDPNYPFDSKVTKTNVAVAYDLGADCEIRGEFRVREPDVKIIYGDAESSPAQFCLGQEVPIHVTISEETQKY